jgi:hypothetical protein
MGDFVDIMEPVKFLYASDLRLDKPLILGEGSGGAFAARARAVAYEATRRLVDCALSRGVDFVILRGELFDAGCGAKALLFLAEQTRRLLSAGIACYILNESAVIDPRWRFPAGLKWFSQDDVKEATIECNFREFPLTELLEPAPPPLQGLSLNESGPGGAWLVCMPDGGAPTREFIELDALRWESCEMDVTSIETEEDLAVSWRATREGFRGLEAAVDRPVLLRLRLTGVMKDRSVFYGQNVARDSGMLMNKLNAEEETRKNFVLIDSLSDETVQPERRDLSPSDVFETDFWEEITFFKSGIDLRFGLFETLKERGILKRVLASDAAPLLENITEADVESLLKESCDMAVYGLLKDARDFK